MTRPSAFKLAFSLMLLLNFFAVQSQITISGSADPMLLTTGLASEIATGLTISSSESITDFTVAITDSFSSNDELGYTGTLPIGVTTTGWNATKRAIVFKGTLTALQWQLFLRNVTIITANVCSPETRKVSFIAGETYYNPLNGHFYRITTTPSSWTVAKETAASTSYYGRQGYLVTLTNAAENTFVSRLIGENSWMGTSDDHDQINEALGYNEYANTNASEGKFYWVTGPEKGTQLTTNNGNGNGVPGVYQNWRNAEPNDHGAGESFGHVYATSGDWNDFPDTSSINGIMEFGDMPGDYATSTPQFTKNVSILGASSGSIIGGNVTVCSGLNTTLLTLTNLTGTVVRWESSSDNFITAGTQIANTSTTLTVENQTETKYYRAVVNSTLPSVCTGLVTSSVPIYVDQAVPGIVFAENTSICAGSDVELYLSGQVGEVVKWQRSSDNANWIDIANTSTTLVETVASTGSVYYRTHVQILGCGVAVISPSKEVTVTSGTAPEGGQVSSNVHGSVLNTGTLTLTGHTGSILKWQFSINDGLIWTDLVNTSTSYTYLNLDVKTLFRAVVSNGSCGTAYSDAGTVSILSPPLVTEFSPTLAGNGETVTITGSGFTGTSSVNFGAASASSFTVVSDTEITATVGVGSSGAITVTNPAGNDSSAGFIYKVAQYDFEDDVLDKTDNDHDGVEVNVVTYETGAQGKAICFDNGPGYVKLPDNLIRSLSEFTISLRFKTTGSGSILGYQKVTPLASAPIYEWIPIIMVTDDGKLKGTLWTSAHNAIQAVSANPVNDGNWHQVDFTAGTNSVAIYLDGNLEATQSGASVAHLDMIFNQIGLSYTSGYNPPATWEYFTGCIDDMLIIDRELTQLEIEEITALPEPSISSFTPTNAGEDDVVVITGTNFDGATQVTFGGVDAQSFTVDSSTQITATIENGNSGNVSVTTAGGIATASGFTFTSKAIITVSVNELDEITYCGGDASPVKNIEVSGTGLYEDMVITAPTGFEVSLNDTTGFTDEITLVPSSNAIGTTTIYVRTKASQNGFLSGNITVNVGSVSQNIAVSASTNNSLYFDGVDDYVSLASTSIQDGATDFTIEAWILPDNSNFDGSYHAIFGNQVGATTTRNPSFYINDGKIHIDSYEDNTLTRYDILTDEPSILQNVWSHIALVKEGAQYSVYVNGVLDFTAPAPGAVNITGPYQFGFIDNYFAGKIDDVRFWSVPRTAAEVAGAMDASLTGLETGLIGYYTFNQGAANDTNIGITALKDKSGAENNGTLLNMALTGSSSNWADGYFPQIIGNSTVIVDQQLQLTHSQNGGVWSSNETGIATVDQSGNVTGVAEGTVTISYALCGQTTIKLLNIVNPTPEITSFTPNFIGALGEVVITGSNFVNISQVQFGGINADSFTVDSTTKITAIVHGSGASGDVSVSNTAGTDTASGFVFNQPPTALSLSNANIVENNTIGDDVGQFTTTDTNTGDTFTYTFSTGVGDGDNASFSIDGNTLKTADVFDYETKSSYSVRIRSTDSGGLTFEDTFEITITDFDEDMDADGVNDSVDECANTPFGEAVDARGCSDTQKDTDLDGINDALDNCKSMANTDQTDTDNDGEGDVCDPDDDNDGTPDTEDAFPTDPDEDSDADGDGTGDNEDLDDDNDGTPDSEDAFPTDPDEDSDADGDGTGDNEDLDDDNDGTPDSEDAFPTDPDEDSDADGDGTGDNEDEDIDGDGIPNNEDAFPYASEGDSDNDGILDADDAFPLDPNESADTDGDGTGDNSDDDDDNDGYSDLVEEAEGTDSTNPNSKPKDTDADGLPDATDDDDDNDGVVDTEDYFPENDEPLLKPAEAFTPNGDGVNDTWMIPGIDNYPNSRVAVYNRWGHEVFNAVSYRNDWNGNRKGASDVLPPGSYLFIIDLGNGKAPLKGWLFINY